VLLMKGNVYTYTEENSGTSQQNIANCISHLWDKLIQWLMLCWRYFQRKKLNGRTKHVKWLKGANLEEPENVCHTPHTRPRNSVFPECHTIMSPFSKPKNH
jgi:hypothetical protein